MATPVPAVERAVDILDLLGAYPHQPLTLSEVVEQLQMSKATAHSTLACLADRGWVHRDETSKGYSLGPAAIRISHCAAVTNIGYEVARFEMFGLTRDLGLSCALAAAIGNEVVVLDSVLLNPTTDLPMRPGWVTPLRPPLGIIFYAWSSTEEIEEWLHRGALSSPEEFEAYRLAIAAIRTRGYSVGSEAEVALDHTKLIERLEAAGEAVPEFAAALTLADYIRRNQPLDRSRGERSSTMMIAPIFGPRGRPVLTLTLLGRPGEITEAAETDYARVLLAAAERATIGIGGHVPRSATVGHTARPSRKAPGRRSTSRAGSVDS
jgi:DNA-binding IclR family transcriptional regulator